MKTPGNSGKTKKPVVENPNDLVTLLSQKVIGQPAAMKYIVPYVEMFQAGLAPEGRPVGVFPRMLLTARCNARPCEPGGRPSVPGESPGSLGGQQYNGARRGR